tara:strand:+ start:1213 stop:1395 length:183 start_codon:yes stop_codon:yes gene_type:complete
MSIRDAHILCLNPVMKNIEPRIKHKIVENNKNGAIYGGMFYLLLLQKFFRNLLFYQGLHK